MDTAAFFQEQTAKDPEGSVDRAELCRAYKEWCEASSHRPLSAKRFNARVRAHLEREPVWLHGQPTWRGIRLLEGEESAPVGEESGEESWWLDHS